MIAPRVRLASLLALFALLLTLVPAPFQASLAAQRPDFSETAATAPEAKIDPRDQTVDHYIVRLRGAPVATHLAEQKGALSAGIDLQSAEATRQQTLLRRERAVALQAIEAIVGDSVTPLHSYEIVFNGMALTLTGAQAAQIASLPQVVQVTREPVYQLNSDAGPQWIGADQIWDGSVTGIYAATVLGANQSPPVTSPATGRGLFNFDPATRTLVYRVLVSGFTEAVTAAHIHRDTDGSVVAAISAASGGVYSGQVVLSETDATLLQTEKLYVNFHTATNPSGVIRGNLSGYKGEGVVVGIIDSGINTTSPSFASVGGDGYRHLNPLGAGTYKGACDPTNLPTRAQGNPSGYNPAIACNDKLIGTWTFTRTFEIDSPAGEPSPNDDDGHGSHTASTAAGNVVLNTTLKGATFPRISGVAPHANIIAYDVCGYLSNDQYSDNCPGAALLAAVEQATRDQVDVINYSISGGASPWTDPVELGFLAARAAGVVVATSAGNSGPGAGTVGHGSPWLLATAAVTHDRKLVNNLTDLTATAGGSSPSITGAGLSSGLATVTPIVYAGAAGIGNALCGPFTVTQAAAVSGKIVVCDRGSYGRVEKAENVQAAGGVGYVLANDAASGDSLIADPFPLPGVHITHNDGVTLKAWLAGATNPNGRISGTLQQRADPNGDIMAGFSSRGPHTGSGSLVLKPDIAAPGVEIYAAVANNGQGPADYSLLSGTSMASPHVAGAAALLAGLYPTWTPGQIQSALATTALAPITKEDGTTPTTPFDSGAGRVRLERAALAGLVLDETQENFEAANPAADGDPRKLNVVGLTDPNCIASCSWTRTVRNVLDVSASWTASTSDARLTVTPSSFTIVPGATQIFTVTMNTAGLPLDKYAFGRVTLSATGAVAPDTAFPVAVQPKASDLPNELDFSSITGSLTVSRSVRLIAYSALNAQRFGLVKATSTIQSLSETQTHTVAVDVPASTARLVAEVPSTTSKDTDIIVYRDSNNSGVLDGADTEVCESASPAALEYCNLVLPAAGRYFVVVLNYEASQANIADAVRIVTAVVPQTTADNFTVTAPPSSTGGSIDLNFSLNPPGSQLGDIWYGWTSLTDTGTSTVLATTSINFYHEPGAPTQVQATGGGTQRTPMGRSFPTPLIVTVRDSSGLPVPGVTVSFAVPASGPSATLSAATVTTGFDGTASVTATANGIPGKYTVTATVEGSDGPVTTSFNLTNLLRVYLPLVHK